METPESGYETRTRRNVEDADGTLILNQGALDGGTAFTGARPPDWQALPDRGAGGRDRTGSGKDEARRLRFILDNHRQNRVAR